MYYIIYKTQNNINNKIYIGKHQTLNINDKYYGSGKVLKESIKKYGKENFTKTILFIFDNENDMNIKEKELVNLEFFSNRNTYNMCEGGEGGPIFLNKKHSDKTKKTLHDIRIGVKHTDETLQKMKLNHWSKTNTESFNSHVKKAGTYKKTDEHKEKLRKSSLNNESGKGNLGKIREKIICPFCKKEGSRNTLIRWHFDNCKLKL